MRTLIVRVTPAQAKSWLASNNVLNRNLRHRLIDKYASDMKAGNWHISHQGIAFYEDGSLADGQHRLAAVIRANIDISFLVTFDIPKESGRAIDQHAQRKMDDALRLGGAPAWLNKEAIAIVRWMASCGQSAAQLSPDQIESYANAFESQIRFAVKLIQTHRRNVTCSGMGCAYVLASLSGEPDDRLQRFSEILYSGMIDASAESAAIRLREYLLSNIGAWNGGHKSGTAKRAQRAIQAFCKGTTLSKLYEPDDWIYPFPALSAVLPDFKMIGRWTSPKLKKFLTESHEEAK